MTEVWLDIPGYETLYQVSDMGRVRISPESPRRKGPSFPGKVLSLQKRDGYLITNLIAPDGIRHGHSVNRLVALAFHGLPPTEKHQAAHIDGNRENNSPSNICWATSKENHGHRVLHGTDPKGERNGRAKLTEKDVLLIRSRVFSGETQISVAEQFGVSNVQVRNIAMGITWGHVQ